MIKFTILSIFSIFLLGCAANLTSTRPLALIDRDQCRYFSNKDILIKQFDKRLDGSLFERNPDQLIKSLQKLFYFKSLNNYSKKYISLNSDELLKNYFLEHDQFDYLIDFQFEQNRRKLSLRRFFSAITLFIFPSLEKSTESLTIKIWDKNKKLIETLNSSDDYQYNVSLLPIYKKPISEENMDIKIEEDLIIKTLGLKCD